MFVFCPHCQTTVDLADDCGQTTVPCPSCGTAINLEALPLVTLAVEAMPVGSIGRFKLLNELGAGTFGVVWKAHDPQLDRLVAVKIARNIGAEAARADFVREARAAAQLHHPHVVSVHDAGYDGDAVYIVSEFIDGPTLREWLKHRQPDAKTAARLTAQLADALHHAHEAGLVHRDVKPSNILMDNRDAPHITDFGLAKRDAGEATIAREGQVLGTLAYMPPEQARGESHHVDRRADLYSLGVILYEMLTGMRPFRGTGQELVQQILYEAPASPRRHNPQVPVELETICLKCLEKTPVQRFQSGAELANELHRFLRGDPIRSHPVSRADRVLRRCARHWVITSLSAGLAVCLLALAVLVLPTWLPEKPIREADAGQWLRDDLCTLSFQPVRGTLMQDAQYPLPVELANRTNQPLDITQIDVEVYNEDVAGRLGMPSPLVFRQRFQVLIHFEKYQHRVVEIPGGQMLPQELIARVSYAPRRFREAWTVTLRCNASCPERQFGAPMLRCIR